MVAGTTQDIGSEYNSSRSSRLVGRTFGQYTLRELIGRGGMAAVYRAEHRVLGHSVAFKLLHPMLSRQPTMTKRFINEACSMAAIAHPGIVAIHDIGRTEDGRMYTVMEMLHGETLGERLDRDGVLDEAQTLSIARQIASALGAAHDNGIVHRDIKPDNIFLAVDPELPSGERAKVLDFGIAKITTDEAKVENLTAVGVVVGTPSYMSPEQCVPNSLVDGRADIYSLGALMFRMLTGERLFRSTDEIAMIHSHRHANPPHPRERGADISAGFETAIMICLSKDPAQRFRSMHELASRLAALEIELAYARLTPAHDDADDTFLEPQRVLALPLPAPLSKSTSDTIARPNAVAKSQPIEYTEVEIDVAEFEATATISTMSHYLNPVANDELSAGNSAAIAADAAAAIAAADADDDDAQTLDQRVSRRPNQELWEAFGL